MTRPRLRGRAAIVALALCAICTSNAASAQGTAAALPELTQPVNDFAGVVDTGHTREMDRFIRALQAKTGDAIVVATVRTFAPYADIREYAVKLFENHGRGIGQKGHDNGLLILLAVDDRKVWVEVGYGLEQWITDGFAGETSRQVMVPAFRRGEYGAGLAAGTARIIGRIAQGRNVTLDAVQAPTEPRRGRGLPLWLIVLVFIAILILSRAGGGPGAPLTRSRRWGGSGWSGWSSGVGPFGGGGGGGFGGGFGGFGGRGGFGGFGGGRSGGGGGGGSW